MLISGRFEVLRKSDMKPNMPFFDLVARVPLRDLVPEEMLGGALERASPEEREGRDSWGSAVKGRSSGVTVTGTERRLVAGAEVFGKRSLRVAVLAREGRGGGEAMGGDLARDGFEGEAAANGSWSPRGGGGVDEERLCLRERGGGFWSELRTLAAEGVFDLKEGGGGGACLVGSNVAGSW